MGIETFMKIGSLKGEATASGFEEQIQLRGWKWGMAQQGIAHHGNGGGKVQVRDLVFTHMLDAASPGLALACCKGTRHPEAVLTMRKSIGGSPLEYYILTLKDAVVTTVENDCQSDIAQHESVSLNFSSFEITYQPHDKDGQPKGGVVEVQYDIAANS